MNLSLKPHSRTKDIIVQETDSEVLIYDMDSHRALTLNDTASRVWRMLDGKRTISDIAKTTQIPAELVLLSIDELQKKNLLGEEVETGLAKDKVSRRKMLTRIAASAVALPVVASIVAPTALQAQSSCNPPTPPSTPSQMLAPGGMVNVGYSGVCDAPCPGVCASFNFDCCSNLLLYAGACTNNGGGPGVAVCACTCA